VCGEGRKQHSRRKRAGHVDLKHKNTGEPNVSAEAPSLTQRGRDKKEKQRHDEDGERMFNENCKVSNMGGKMHATIHITAKDVTPVQK